MSKTYEAMYKSAWTLNAPLTETAASPKLLIKNPENVEQLRNLEQQVALLMQKNDYKVFHFTGSKEKEGVSNITLNLTRFMSEKKPAKNILLIDANLHHPVLHAELNVPANPGLRDALSGTIPYNECVHKFNYGSITLMPCGKKASDVSDSIHQDKMSELIAKLKPQYDCVIIDSSPLLESSDSLSLAFASDVTFLVVQANRTRWEVAEKSKLYLEKNSCRLGGVILNRVTHTIPEWIYKRL